MEVEMRGEECKHLIELIQCDTESEPCIWISDSITNLKPRIWKPFCLFCTPIRYLPPIAICLGDRRRKKRQYILRILQNSSNNLQNLLHFACHFLLVISCLCSEFSIHHSFYTFNLLHPEGPSLNSNLASCTYTGLSALILTTRTKPTPGEACYRSQKYSSSWSGGPKCTAQSYCTSVTDSPSQNASSSFLFSLLMSLVRYW